MQPHSRTTNKYFSLSSITQNTGNGEDKSYIKPKISDGKRNQSKLKLPACTLSNEMETKELLALGTSVTPTGKRNQNDSS